MTDGSNSSTTSTIHHPTPDRSLRSTPAGARLVRMDRATLWLSVAAPPWTDQDCRRVAVEHFAFCCDVDGEDLRPLRVYVATLRRVRRWRFWWD